MSDYSPIDWGALDDGGILSIPDPVPPPPDPGTDNTVYDTGSVFTATGADPGPPPDTSGWPNLNDVPTLPVDTSAPPPPDAQCGDPGFIGPCLSGTGVDGSTTGGPNTGGADAAKSKPASGSSGGGSGVTFSNQPPKPTASPVASAASALSGLPSWFWLLIAIIAALLLISSSKNSAPVEQVVRV